MIRPLIPRSFTSLSQAEEENGQSRIYLGIHWSFDKTQGTAQGRRVARYEYDNAFQRRSARYRAASAGFSSKQYRPAPCHQKFCPSPSDVRSKTAQSWYAFGPVTRYS